MPICFIVAGKENCVRNDYIEEFSRHVSNDQGEYHVIEEADHTDICFHEDYASQLIRYTQAFLDKVAD